MRSSRVYICHTYYHVLVSIIKVMENNKEEADIVLCDTIPGQRRLLESLNQSQIFKNIYLYDEKKYKNVIDIRNQLGILFINSRIKRGISPNFELRKTTYKEVNIFNDWTSIGYYLRANKIYYNLLEDAKDSYKVLENYIKVDYQKTIKHRIFGFVYETLFFHGKSKYTKVVEVNNDNGIKIPNEKVRVLNKEKMFSRLTEVQKKKVYSIFINDEVVGVNKNRNSALILTQPLFEDKMVQSEEVQKEIYQEIVDTYCSGLNVVIKPHPRDKFNYNSVFSNVKVIDKNIPTEILNFNPNIKFNKAITISSTSINGIDFVNEKIYLGFDWLKKHL